MSMKLSIILPIYNEQDNIPQLIQEIEETILPLKIEFEILAINDCSKDRSLEILEKLAQTRSYLKVISFFTNSGQTAAFDAGFKNAQGQIVVTMDSDLQNDPRDIPKMMKLIDEGHDYVTGWREKRQDGLFLRKIPSLIANFIIRKVTKTKLKDLGCSLKVYRKSVVDQLHLYGEMHRFIGVLIESMGVRVAQVPVNHRPRMAGVSKYGINRTFKVILDLLTVWFMKGFRSKPVYVFGGTGLFCFFLSFLTLAMTVYQKFGFETKIHRNPLFIISMVLLLVGVQMLAIGLLADMLMRTYFESQNIRPYVIAKRVNFS
ncbi:MAG: glycosyltransferase family 2 protein [Bacteriovoracaceae bacterium]